MTSPVFVAEFTTNHLGHLALLLRMVEQAAAAGCSRIKMQKKEVESYYSAAKLDAPYDSPFGKTYRDYRTIFELSRVDFERFDAHCRACRVPWFATVQDLASLDFMLTFDLPAYKIASSNARNQALLVEMAQRIGHDREIVLSVAGSTLAEIEQALAAFVNHRCIWLLHCVAEYPCRAEHLRLGNIPILRRCFASDQVRIGYSGHEQGIGASLAALALGAEMVERHFCLSRHSFAHHIECSLEPQELASLIAAGSTRPAIEDVVGLLPASAFSSSFGMSEAERSFLVDQTYGRTYLGQQSSFSRPEGQQPAPLSRTAREESCLAPTSRSRRYTGELACTANHQAGPQHDA